MLLVLLNLGDARNVLTIGNAMEGRSTVNAGEHSVATISSGNKEVGLYIVLFFQQAARRILTCACPTAPSSNCSDNGHTQMRAFYSMNWIK
jgi:hypothetical protein